MLLAVHPVLEGRLQSSILPGHRTLVIRLAERQRRPPAGEQPLHSGRSICITVSHAAWLGQLMRTIPPSPLERIRQHLV